ncbi:hypothetical protein ACF1A5_00885 [Streptomyces sp. NPDC014864]|uniref:hypothetical protein n=1 Tax=Streptomyces sp. NPDC014864 TaxID=3364924 RepID=UPI0036FDA437
MSHQPYPQQPDPQQGWGAPPPQPPKKKGKGKIAGLGCLGVVVLIGIVSAVSGGGSGKSDDSKSATSASKQEKPAAGKAGGKSAGKSKADDTKKDSAKKTVVFKVWGTAPAGALGSLDITYGSDSDNRKGKFASGKFEATLPVNKDAMYYSVTAQLQGSGDINCSVTIGGKTKKGHAAGGYNICQTQLNAGLLGGWD